MKYNFVQRCSSMADIKQDNGWTVKCTAFIHLFLCIIHSLPILHTAQYVRKTGPAGGRLCGNPKLRPTQCIQRHIFYALFLFSNILMTLSVCYSSFSHYIGCCGRCFGRGASLYRHRSQLFGRLWVRLPLPTGQFSEI